MHYPRKFADPRLDGGNVKFGSIAYATYSDSITTNGGQISEVKSYLNAHPWKASRAVQC